MNSTRTLVYELLKMLDERGFEAVPDVIGAIKASDWEYNRSALANIESQGIQQGSVLYPGTYITQLKILIGSMRTAYVAPLHHNFPIKPSWFIGRETILAAIHKEMSDTDNGQPIVLLYGIGGMGKTTIMQQYLHERVCQDHFRRIIVIRVDKNLRQIFISETARALQIDLKQIAEGQELDVVLEAMRNCAGHNLFVIDNINESDLEDLTGMQDDFLRSGWKFLITTRTHPYGFFTVDVNELDLTDAMQLFAYHHTTDFAIKRNTDQLADYASALDANGQLKTLLTHIECHTLLTELLAKAAEKNNYTPSELNKILKDIDTAHPEIERPMLIYQEESLQREIVVGSHARDRSKDEKRKVTIKYYISSLFDVTYLVTATGDPAIDEENKAQTIMLHFFSVLPADDILIEDLTILWKVSKPDINVFENRLHTIYESGWIQCKQVFVPETQIVQNLTYRMHPLVQEVVYDKLKPDVDSCGPLIETITDVLSKTHAYPQNYQRYAKSVIDKLNMLYQEEA